MSEATLAGKELEVQEKQEVASTEEPTTQGRYYTPLTDIYESEEALMVVMEIPGVDKKDLHVNLDKDQLAVEARISLEPYSNMKPLYTEYGVGNYTRRFQLSNAIDRSRIQAMVKDGVLTLTLPKVAEATPRSIEIQ